MCTSGMWRLRVSSQQQPKAGSACALLPLDATDRDPPECLSPGAHQLPSSLPVPTILSTWPNCSFRTVLNVTLVVGRASTATAAFAVTAGAATRRAGRAVAAAVRRAGAVTAWLMGRAPAEVSEQATCKTAFSREHGLCWIGAGAPAGRAVALRPRRTGGRCGLWAVLAAPAGLTTAARAPEARCVALGSCRAVVA